MSIWLGKGYLFWALVDEGSDQFGEVSQSCFLNIGCQSFEDEVHDRVVFLYLNHFVFLGGVFVENGLDEFFREVGEDFNGPMRLLFV